MPSLSVIAACRPRGWRRGAAMVETAAVLSLFLLLLFGVMEYCRLIFMRQLIENATREGARFAVVNTNDPNLVADTQTSVNRAMAGMNNGLNNYAVTVYQADSNGNNIGAASSAQFGQYICVQIDGDYNPIAPVLLLLGNNLHFTQKTMMYSEAN